MVVPTAWLIVPVLASEKAPPPPIAIFVGTDDHNILTVGAPASVIELNVTDSDCRNPATIEGVYVRSSKTWNTDAKDARAVGSRVPLGPTEAEVLLVGAHVDSAVTGLGTSFGLVSNSTVGAFREPLVSGNGIYEWPSGKRVVVHNTSVQILAARVLTDQSEPLGGDYLAAPDWPVLRTDLHFIIKADIVERTGYRGCYLGLPALLGTASESTERTSTDGFEFASRWLPTAGPYKDLKGGQGVPNQDDVGYAAVTAEIPGYEPNPDTIGDGGKTTSTGVEYACNTKVDEKPPSDLDPSMFAGSVPGTSSYGSFENPDCAAAPLFTAPDAGADSTRRIFLAGIIGALAATLLIEALFVGEEADRAERDRKPVEGPQSE